jgi:hypothetical protein
MENYSLSCNNKNVFEFYEKHSNLDFETMNILFVNILEELNKDISSSLSNNIATQLLTNIKGLQEQVSTINENIRKMHLETQNNFGIKFNEFKSEYVKDITHLLNSNTLDKLGPLIKEYNSNLFDKTFIMINDIVPKNNDTLLNQIRENIRVFHNSINEDTNKLLNSSLNQKSLDDFIHTIENKFSGSQQLINSIINASEQRLDTKVDDLREKMIDIRENSSRQQNIVSELLKKMEISSFKGACSENILFNILQSLYPSGQIDNVGQQKETGDIMLIRKNKPTILIENKNWNKNVVQEEVKKFIRDVETQNCCGLFLSQNFGIANKENFEININNGNILLYVHEVNNDAEKIKMAIDIIDNFKIKLDECCSNNDGYTIDTEVLDEINKEYQLFISQKQSQIKNIKDFSTKMVKQIEETQLPSLEKFLSTKYAFSSSKYVCEFCEFVAKNQQSMSAHKRGCKFKNSILSDIEVNAESSIIIATSENKKPKPKTKN